MKNNNLPIPTEDAESKAFVHWLNFKGIPHHHSANEVPLQKKTGVRGDGRPIWTRSFATLARLKTMGVSKGFPDYIVIIPANKSRSGKALLLAIEMKRVKGGTTSPEQKEWLSLLGQVADCEGFVCKGAEEAIKAVQQFIF